MYALFLFLIYAWIRLVFAAQAHKTVLTWKGVSSGCLARINAAIPAICGAAKLFPVQVICCF